MVFIEFASKDDLHKAIKYGILCLGEQENKQLETLVAQNQSRERPTVIAVKMKEEQSFVGLAKITQNIDQRIKYLYWEDGSKSALGNFQIKWLFIKTVEWREIGDAIQEERYLGLYRNLEVIQKRTANSIFRRFINNPFEFETSIFYFFKILDQREDQMIQQRKVSDVKISLQKRPKQANKFKKYFTAKKERTNDQKRANSSANEAEWNLYVKKP